MHVLIGLTDMLDILVYHRCLSVAYFSSSFNKHFNHISKAIELLNYYLSGPKSTSIKLSSHSISPCGEKSSF